jgi:uncharacterized protein YeaO (DUF488 family)
VIRVKHLMDGAEKDDGVRLWVEGIGLTLDLKAWCKVDEIADHLGPPGKLTRWFHKHPDHYDDFRGRYHAHLDKSPYRPALRQLANVGLKRDITLLHTGGDPNENTAAALHDYLTSMQTLAVDDE